MKRERDQERDKYIDLIVDNKKLKVLEFILLRQKELEQLKEKVEESTTNLSNNSQRSHREEDNYTQSVASSATNQSFSYQQPIQKKWTLTGMIGIGKKNDRSNSQYDNQQNRLQLPPPRPSITATKESGSDSDRNQIDEQRLVIQTMQQQIQLKLTECNGLQQQLKKSDELIGQLKFDLAMIKQENEDY